MKKTILTLFAGTTVLLISCGTEETNEPGLTTTTVTTDEVVTTDVNWEYDHSTTAVKWTGYKLESKAGVSGEFDSIVVTGFTPGPDAAAAITGVTFEIYTQSINSADSTRDWKLANVLFGEMGTDVITGEIKAVADGKAMVDVMMGGVTMPVEMSYEMNAENVVKLVGNIILPSWGDQAKAGFDAIAEACKEKHEGVTWEDVEIKVFTKLKKADS